jgi:hypothetical protein
VRQAPAQWRDGPSPRGPISACGWGRFAGPPASQATRRLFIARHAARLPGGAFCWAVPAEARNALPSQKTCPGAHVGDEAASDRGRQFYGPKRHGLEIGALTANSEIRPPRRRPPAGVSRVRAAVTRQEYQCPNFQFQAIASAASSISATISSGSKAIGTHARFKAGRKPAHTRPECPSPEYQGAVKS